MLYFSIRYFFIFITSIYLYMKILNLSIKYYFIIPTIILSASLSLIDWYLYSILNITPAFSLILLLFLFSGLLKSKNIKTRIYTSLISSGISYAIYLISIFLISTILYLLFFKEDDHKTLDVINLLLSGFLQFLIVFLLFRIRRFRKGIPDIEKIYEKSSLVFICGLIVILISFAEFIDNASIFIVSFLIITLSSFVVYFEIKKNIKQTYLNTLHTQERDQLELLLHSKEDEILALKRDVDNLSKMIHKDNKLIPAFMTAVEDLYLQNKDSKSDQLLQELHHFMHDRNYTLNYQNKGDDTLQKTGIASIDYVMKYLHLRAMNEKIVFRVAITTEPFSLSDTPCHQNDLRTLLADLGENAVHASANNENSSVYVELGFQEDILFLSVYDTGHYFDYEVLKNIGKSRFTTRLKNGGSGIGLMQTMEILNRYQASFQLKEFTADSDYRKAIHIRFDSRNKREICSDRSELTKLKSIRSDWYFTAS